MDALGTPTPASTRRHDHLRAEARLRIKQRRNRDRYTRDPWGFLCDGVHTLDQVKGGWIADGDAGTGRVRPLISADERHDDFYLAHLTRYWMAHPLVAVPKSRRMRISWWGIAIHLWLALHRRGTKIAFVSRKEGRDESEGSAELVWRAKFILDHLPKTIPHPSAEYKFCRLAFPDLDSEIIGVGQGADQLRQHTITAILGDECAFWEHARQFYAASKPTIEGGGRLTLISSANPGFFEQLVHDRL